MRSKPSLRETLLTIERESESYQEYLTVLPNGSLTDNDASHIKKLIERIHDSKKALKDEIKRCVKLARHLAELQLQYLRLKDIAESSAVSYTFLHNHIADSLKLCYKGIVTAVSSDGEQIDVKTEMIKNCHTQIHLIILMAYIQRRSWIGRLCSKAGKWIGKLCSKAGKWLTEKRSELVTSILGGLVVAGILYIVGIKSCG